MLTAIVVVVVLLVIVAAVVAYGSIRWRAGTVALRAKLEAARCPVRPATYLAQEVESLPAPVRRYFRAVLKEGQPLVRAVRLTHEGQFNMGEKQAKWSRFKSTQLTLTQRPGFDWDARIAIAPGVNVFVHDAYVAGEGRLHAELLGLVPLADLRGTPEVAAGELMRFLAEAAWYPTALLPSQGVLWEAIDEASARATLADGATTVSLDFRFDTEGLIGGVRASARHRTVNGVPVAAPWQGRFWNYQLRGGMRIPLEGEVSWELPQGLWPYWRGLIREISHDFS